MTRAVRQSTRHCNDAESTGIGPPAGNPSARSLLMQETDALVDTYAQVLERAPTDGGRLDALNYCFVEDRNK